MPLHINPDLRDLISRITGAGRRVRRIRIAGAGIGQLLRQDPQRVDLEQLTAAGVEAESSDRDRVPVRDIQKERLRDKASNRLGVLGAQNANVIDQILIRVDHIQVRDIRFFQS